MFSNNFVQLALNIIFYAFYFFVYGDDTLSRILQNPILLRDVILIGTSGALGQIFLYLTISLFNCHLLTVITTSRKLISVVLSNFSFHHHFTSQQWVGAVLVMCCTVGELFIGKKNKEIEQHEQSKQETAQPDNKKVQ